MPIMKIFLLSGALALSAAAASTGCVVSVDSQGEILREDKRFPVSGVPELRLTTFDGTIDLRPADRDEVHVEIEKRGPTKEAVDALEVASSQEGNLIVVEVKRPSRERFTGIGFHHAASARLTVTVPRRANVTARTGDGSIRVEGLEGRLELRTGDGSIRASEVAGDLRLHTGDGSVAVDRARGTLDLDTGDGGVDVSGALSRVKMHTGDGSIVLRVEPGAAMDGDWEITTGDGGITLYLPENFDAEIDASTGDGRVSNDLTLVSGGTSGENRRSVRGRLGSGGRTLRLRTGDGSIRLRSH
jgi:hypothetical protein